MNIFWKVCVIIICCFLQQSWARVTTSGNSKRTNITQNKFDAQWINTNTFAISPHSLIRPFQQKGLPGVSSNQKWYNVKNIGHVGVHAYVRGGGAFAWDSVISSANLHPGDFVRLDPTQTRAYTELTVEVYQNSRAFVQCFVGEGYSVTKSWKTSWNFDIDINNLMKKLVTFGSDQIPVVGPIISNVIDFFWPSTSIDAWEEIKDKVVNLIDASISDLVENILNNKIRVYKKRIQIIAIEQARRVKKSRIGDHYLNIAQDMVGLEEDFVFHQEASANYQKINYATLPLFSLVISMKILFLRCGFENPDALGLDEDDMEELKIYAEETLRPDTGVVYKHFQNVLEHKIQYAFENVDPENLFNEISDILTYVAFNGEEYLAVWNDMVEGSPAKGKPYNSILRYPSYVGTPTADLLSLGGRQPLMRTLTPNLLKNGKRARIVKVIVHTFQSHAVGIDVHYNDLSVISTGLRDGTTLDEFTIEPHYLVKLEVWGNFPKGIVTALNLITDGGNETTYMSGTPEGAVSTFEMTEHHIAGIHMSNDMGMTQSYAWNVAVSFQADNVYHE